MKRRNVHIINVQRPDISQPLDVGRALLALRISHVQIQLLYSAFDGIPTSQPRGEVDISGKPEICRVNDLVGARVRQDGFGMDTSLVGEGAETGNVVVEGDVDFNRLRNKILQVSQLVKLVLTDHIVAIGDNHSGHEATQRGDAVPLSNTQHRGVDMGRTSLEGTVGVCNGTSSIVVEMCLNVTRDDTPQGTDEVVDLPGRSTSNSVGNTLKIYES